MKQQQHEHHDSVSSSSSVQHKHKIWVEVCLISARGLPRSSLLKPHWYAVGWLHPTDKYCTQIDTSGTSNPVWKTKFTTLLEGSESELQNMQLHVEVYSREPVFLREKLQGTATVSLREFVGGKGRELEGVGKGREEVEVGSFQLRKKGSEKAIGFVDVSVRVGQDKEMASSGTYLGKEEGFNLNDGSSGITNTGGPMQVYPPGQAGPPFLHHPGKPHPPPPANHPFAQPAPAPYPANYSNPPVNGTGYPPPIGPSYPPPPLQTPPPPPPPANVGYIPTFMPQTNNQPTSYINMPSSVPGMGRGGVPPGFGVGLGAGALAAGAVIFGDDFMSGFQLPSVSHHGSLTISTDPPF